MDNDKHFNLIINIMIGLLVVAIIILLDHLAINIKSQPSDYNWQDSTEIASAQKENGINAGMKKIEPGEKTFLPILNFHHIGTAPMNADKISKSFYLGPKKFEDLLKSLMDNGYHAVFASDAVSYLQTMQIPENKIMVITFDDGNEDFYTNAWPILQEYQIKSSMYIMTGVRGEDWLTEEQIKELDKSGLVEFGSHTVWHPKLTKATSEEIDSELYDSKEFLEKLLNKQINILAYPFGLYNEEIKNKTESAGYISGLTFDQDAWQNPDDLFVLTRISVYPELNVVKFLDELRNGK